MMFSGDVCIEYSTAVAADGEGASVLRPLCSGVAIHDMDHEVMPCFDVSVALWDWTYDSVVACVALGVVDGRVVWW